jgi:microcystin-dependent protein
MAAIYPDGMNIVREYMVPVGAILPFHGTTPPDGYLVCNGQSFNSADYPELYGVLGKSTLPDLTGKFLRGLGGNAAVLGVAQGDAIRNIQGGVFEVSWYENFGFAPIWDIVTVGATGRAHTSHEAAGFKLIYLQLDVSKDPAMSTAIENRPVNVAVNYIIKVDW